MSDRVYEREVAKRERVMKCVRERCREKRESDGVFGRERDREREREKDRVSGRE